MDSRQAPRSHRANESEPKCATLAVVVHDPKDAIQNEKVEEEEKQLE